MGKNICLVYIMGRGHSGSTVLDALLGNAGEVISIGELISGLSRYEAETCSCGLPFMDCPFWTKVRASFNQRSTTNLRRAGSLLLSQANLRRFISTFTASSDSPRVRELCQINDDIIYVLLNASGKQVVIDSSKEHTRGLFLMRFIPNSKIIHLVRNPERVISSYYYRIEEGKPLKFLRKLYFPKGFLFFPIVLLSISWIVGDILSEIIRLHSPSRLIKIKYEDLCLNPKRELERLGRFIGVDLKDVIEDMANARIMSIGHNIGGNEMRWGKRFVFDPEAKSRRFLPPAYKILVRVVCWPFMLRYGYSPFSSLDS